MIDNSKLVIGNVTFGPAPKTVVTGGHTPTPAALTEQRARDRAREDKDDPRPDRRRVRCAYSASLGNWRFRIPQASWR